MKRFFNLLPIEDPEDEEINLTPLIDVVFVVLIMFILIAPLVEIDRIQLSSKGQSQKKPMVSSPQEGALKIYVYDDNSVWLNGVSVTIEELSKILKNSSFQTKSLTPQVFHDKKGHFGTYQAIKNALEYAGFDAVDVILKSE